MAEKLQVNPKSIHGYIVGEHGDSSVPVWSGFTVGGVVLRSLFPTLGKNDEWDELVKQVKQSAYEVIKLKGYTSWSIGMCVAVLCSALLSDTEEIFPVSVSVKGLYGVKDDVFVSLPAVLTSSGVRDIVNLRLEKDELDKLNESVQSMLKIQQGIKFD
eukprot:Phypoly_transcript_18113.p1 GENE.Phypoly_transcript_18113~~Phypoly_transcript_18113.p1  ORF type:complete len:174 (+),score=24.62 Phypoly_transcript_18113:50-523(+)